MANATPCAISHSIKPGRPPTRFAFTVPMSPASALTPRFKLPWAPASKTAHPLTWPRASNFRVRSVLTVYIFLSTFISSVCQIANPNVQKLPPVTRPVTLAVLLNVARLPRLRKPPPRLLPPPPRDPIPLPPLSSCHLSQSSSL